MPTGCQALPKLPPPTTHTHEDMPPNLPGREELLLNSVKETATQKDYVIVRLAFRHSKENSKGSIFDKYSNNKD